MRPFVCDLSRSRLDGRHCADATKLGSVEAITPLDGFLVQTIQIRIDGLQRAGVLLKSQQLGMMLVAAREAAEYCFGEERLSPASDERLSIKVSGME